MNISPHQRTEAANIFKMVFYAGVQSTKPPGVRIKTPIMQPEEALAAIEALFDSEVTENQGISPGFLETSTPCMDINCVSKEHPHAWSSQIFVPQAKDKAE